MTSAASSTTHADVGQRPGARRTRRLVLSAAACALALTASSAYAAEPSPARELFVEGRTLLDAKRYDEACPKLAESQRLEPGAGTLLALAMCHEGQGKPATASIELKRASELGRKNGRHDLAAAAEKRALALEASVPHVAIRLPATEGETYRVRCDDVPIAPADLGTPIPVDPGEHRVHVSADGKIARSYTVKVTGPGSLEIIVDKLDDAAEPAKAEAPVAKPQPNLTTAPARLGDEYDPNRGSAQRTAGVLVAAAGVIGIGVGAYFGGRALSESSQSKRLCPSGGDCETGEAQDLNDASKRSFRNSVILLSAGTAVLTAGAVVYFLAPRPRDPRGVANPPRRTAHVVPSIGPGGASLGVVGTF